MVQVIGKKLSGVIGQGDAASALLMRDLCQLVIGRIPMTHLRLPEPDNVQRTVFLYVTKGLWVRLHLSFTARSLLALNSG